MGINEIEKKITVIAVKVYEMAMKASEREPYDESVVRKATLEWAIGEFLSLETKDYRIAVIKKGETPECVGPHEV